MRVVSWIIVAASIVALSYPSLAPVVTRMTLPTVAMDQVTGATVYTPGIRSPETLKEFAERYTGAWNSQDPERVSEFYAEDGSLSINDAAAHVGREEIADAAAEFMRTFPDLRVSMRDLEARNGKLIYHWTLEGTHSGPEGTGRRVRINGTETWILDKEGLIARSRGRYDEREYARQVARAD